MFGLNAIERNPLSTDRARDQEGSGFDSVRNDVVLGAMQFRYALDGDAARPGTLDPCAHLVEEIRQVADFRFGGGAFDHGNAFREHRGHHHVVSSENGRAEFAAQVNDCAGELWRENFDVAVFHPDCGAERLKTFEMKVDRAITNNAAARERNGGFFAPA
jgi:hypothetical protein